MVLQVHRQLAAGAQARRDRAQPLRRVHVRERRLVHALLARRQ